MATFRILYVVRVPSTFYTIYAEALKEVTIKAATTILGT